jgi:phospholipase C
VRVPAVIVSPQIAKGVVDGTLYDHASVSATLNAIFETGTLTRRDALANNLTALLNVFPPRTDCPTKLPKVSRLSVKNDAAVLDEAALAAQPLPERGNEIGLLMLLGKRDVALSGGDEAAAAAAAVRARMEAIETRGDLAAYAAEVEAKRLMAYPPRDGDADDEDWITADFWTDEST